MNTWTREQLIFKAGLQGFFILGSIALTMLFTMPKLDEISAQATSTNNVIEKYENIEEKGITAWELPNVIKSVGDNNELLDLVNQLPEETEKVIVKPNIPDPYLKWLKSAINGNQKDIEKLRESKARINSIVPTLSPISNNINENNITLRDYIFFIEQNILQKFSLVSLSPIGINNITYEKEKEKDEKKKTSNPIGYFSMELTFSSTNQKIRELLDFIHQSGHPEILNSEEPLNKIPDPMSNPLVVVDSLSLEQAIDLRYPTLENKGRIVLKFFIRWGSEADSTFLVEAFNKKRNDFEKRLNEKITACKSTGTPCIQMPALETIRKRYERFEKTFNNIVSEKKGNPIETVYIVAQQLNTLQALEKDFSNI